MTTLPAFDAAARHLSFTKAAAELFVTHGAISCAAKNLEEQLGVALFAGNAVGKANGGRRALCLGGKRSARPTGRGHDRCDDAPFGHDPHRKHLGWLRGQMACAAALPLPSGS